VNVKAFIDAKKAEYPVGVICNALGVSRSGYYARAKRPPSARADRDEELRAQIVEIHTESRGAYGRPRVKDALAKRGERVSGKRVARIMREEKLRGKRRPAFRTTTQSDHVLPIAPNLIDRNFTTTKPNEVWVGDITYVPTRQGWLYLAVLIDLFSRKVVGWATSDSLHTELATRALEAAIESRNPPRGLIHHSDRGVQYASANYRDALSERGIGQSMSRKGDCWDNAVAESFPLCQHA